MTSGLGRWKSWRSLAWLVPLLAFGGLLGLSQPAVGLGSGDTPQAVHSKAPPLSQASAAGLFPVEGEPLLVSGEFIAAPTTGLPEPMCTQPPGQQQCAVTSVDGNAQGDVFATFATSPFSPGDLGLYRLLDGEERWQRLDVADSAMPMAGTAAYVPSVTVSDDGSVFALAFWSAGDEGKILRSRDNGATWEGYARAAAGTILVSVDEADTLWVGSVDGLLRSLHPASVFVPASVRAAMLNQVRRDCFSAGARAGEFIEFADGSFACRFPDGGLITCSPLLSCAISGPSGVTGSYPARD